MRPLLLFLCLVTFALAGNVLFLPSTLYPVHPANMAVLANELVRLGHSVTWMEHGPKESNVELAKEVRKLYWQVGFGDRALSNIFVGRNHSQQAWIWEAGYDLPNEQTTAWLASVRLCDNLLKNRRADFDELVKERFDSVIVDDLYNPCGLLQAALKGSVYIYWSQTALRTESAWANQSPSPPSYLPVPGTKLTEDLTFPERVFNVVSYLRALYIHQHIIHNRIDKVFQKHYPGVASAFFIERNASINYVNTPPIFDFARPYMPRVNFVGGLHCKNATKLTGELGNFADSATEGFIVVSGGHTARWLAAPTRVKDIFFESMEANLNIRFIWQMDGDKSGLPKNVLVQDWLPLQDLLGHPKCLAHISHGGLNSVIESVWHGVPVIGHPLTARGYDNLLRLTHRGAGIMVSKEDLTTKTLTTAIKNIQLPKFKEEILVFQDMVRDVPYTELEHAAFWVEFIERHQEVPHARSGADKLNVFQYFLVDVILFLASIVIIIISLVIFLLKQVFRSFMWLVSLVFKKKQTVPKISKSKKKN